MKNVLFSSVLLVTLYLASSWSIFPADEVPIDAEIVSKNSSELNSTTAEENSTIVTETVITVTEVEKDESPTKEGKSYFLTSSFDVPAIDLLPPKESR